MMPDWLRHVLENKTGGFRAARWQRCPQCDRITLHGMDADACAGMVTVDPTPITRHQEIWCALHARPTYQLRIDPDRKITINDRPRYSLGLECRNPVVPEHQCGSEYPGFLDLPPRGSNETAGTEPPF
jgi:hypothetical protein